MNEGQQQIVYLKLRGYLPARKLQPFREKLASADEETGEALLSEVWKSPTITILLSLFLGGLGVDRFYAGDTTGGFIKLLVTLFAGWFLFWLIAVWWLLDVFWVADVAKRTNLKRARAILAGIIPAHFSDR